MFDVRGLAIKVMNMSEEEQHKEIFNEIEKAGYQIKSVGGRKKQFQGAYCIGNGVVVVKLEKEGVLYPVIVDEDKYNNYLANGKGYVNLQVRNDKGWKPLMKSQTGHFEGKIWHAVIGIPAGKTSIDHIRNNTLINLWRELRPCTDSENKNNSSKRRFNSYKEFNPNADEYNYSLARDCSHTLYAYVLMLLGDITIDELAEVNKIVNGCRLVPEKEGKKKNYLELCSKHDIDIKDWIE